MVAALLSVAGPARADVQYDTLGDDVYRIAASQTSSRVSYSGTQLLSIRQQGSNWRFEAHARYLRNGPDGKSRAEARFVQVLTTKGAFEDRVDDDPDFLTILNQPFAVRLDSTTLHELSALRGRVPFAATSPLGAEAVLHGYLRPMPAGRIESQPSIGVRFEAQGAMTGPLPGYSETLVSGTIRMDATAYYASRNGTLLALAITLTLDARLAQGRPPVSVPVLIRYRRSMRATPKTLPPTPLVRGDETVAPATP
ncbi:MAG: hypothetical protein JOZ77_11115 [Candidatus Eremiobacteraeota bacterium]|nr:hypothetical protein [Candidatus Eremiobacteraeota bacterium]